jgi:hypothetical protein
MEKTANVCCTSISGQKPRDCSISGQHGSVDVKMKHVSPKRRHHCPLPHGAKTQEQKSTPITNHCERPEISNSNVESYQIIRILTISSGKNLSLTFLRYDMDCIENDASNNSSLPRKRLHRVVT